jgi:hypothetical protein
MCRLRPPEPLTHCTRATNGGAGDDVVPVAEAGPLVEGPGVEVVAGGGVVVADGADDGAGGVAGEEPAGADEQPPRTASAAHTGTPSAAPANRDLQAAVMPPSSRTGR